MKITLECTVVSCLNTLILQRGDKVIVHNGVILGKHLDAEEKDPGEVWTIDGLRKSLSTRTDLCATAREIAIMHQMGKNAPTDKRIVFGRLITALIREKFLRPLSEDVSLGKRYPRYVLAQR